MTYKREVEKVLENAGFSYQGSCLDGTQVWVTPDGDEKFYLEMSECDDE